MRTETDIKKEIAAYLDSLGDKCWHVPYIHMGYGVSGTPDRLACYRGVFFTPEVKRKGEKARKSQERQHARINAAGGWAKVVTTVEEVQQMVAEIDKHLNNVL